MSQTKFHALIMLTTILAAISTAGAAQERQPRNLVLFVADGLRAMSVTPEQWAETLRTHGFDMDLETDFDVRTFS